MERLKRPFANERASLLELGAIDGRDARNLGLGGSGVGFVILMVFLGGFYVSHARLPGVRPGGLIAITVVIAVCLVVIWRLREIPLAALRPLFLLAVAILAGAAYCVGPRALPYAAVYFGWIGALFPFFSRRQSGAIVLLSVVACAGVIAVQPGHWDPLIEWALIVGTVMVTASIFEFLVHEATVIALDERRSRTRLESATAELAVVNQQKREFLASVSHELRTPLNAVIGFADVLAARFFGPLNERQADYVNDIRSSGRHLLELIGDVFDVRKVESGALVLDVGPVDVADVVTNAVGLFHAQAAQRGVALRLLSRTHPVIDGDERKIRQVVMNLVANAVEFTPRGGEIVVEVAERGEYATVAVRDTGPGIAPEDHDRIFRAFEQGSVRRGGTGLGLPLARRFVEAHGGRLDLESRVGAGSTFRFALPRYPSLPENVAPRATPVEPAASVVTEARGGNAVVIRMASSAFILCALTWPILILHRHRIPGMSAWFLSIMLAGALFVLVCRVARGAWPQISLWVLIIVGVTFPYFEYLAGPFLGPTGITCYAWFCVCIVASLRGWRATLVMGALGVSSFIVRLYVPSPVPVFMRWVATMGSAYGAAWGARWLLDRMAVLVRAERDARFEAERSWEELDQLSRHKSEFIANMSHELRSPLNAIIGFADVLREELFGPLNPKQAEYVDDIVGAGRQLLALINDILDLAKAQAGRVELVVEETATAESVACDDLAALIADKHLDLRVDIAPDAASITGDAVRLQRAIGNLLANAVHFSPPGGRIDVSVRRDNGLLLVDVRDQGPGIPLADQDRIFDEFQHAGPAGLAKAGAGLGLAVARMCVELHGGSLELESVPGWGSVFRLSIPQPAPELDMATEPAEPMAL